MKILLSYLLLFFYVLTSTGASVYMHQCHGGIVSVKQEGPKTAIENCPMCTKHHEEPSSASCMLDENGCCKDIKIDLKKSTDDAEHTQISASFLSLSPATITLFWISTLYEDPINEDAQPRLSSPHVLAVTNPTYLIHCNFRI